MDKYTSENEVAATNMMNANAVSGDVSKAEEWKICGTCEWRVNPDGVLVLRPAYGAAEGVLGKWRFGHTPWLEMQRRDTIRRVVVQRGVVARTCEGMFASCTGLESADLSGLDTSKVENFYDMFRGCTNLTDINVGNMFTFSAKNMSYMFAYCKSLKYLDLRFLITGNVANFDSMFAGCKALRNLDISHFTFDSACSAEYMFASCESLAFIFHDGAFSFPFEANLRGIFDNCRLQPVKRVTFSN